MLDENPKRIIILVESHLTFLFLNLKSTEGEREQSDSHHVVVNEDSERGHANGNWLLVQL